MSSRAGAPPCATCRPPGALQPAPPAAARWRPAGWGGCGGGRVAAGGSKAAVWWINPRSTHLGLHEQGGPLLQLHVLLPYDALWGGRCKSFRGLHLSGPPNSRQRGAAESGGQFGDGCGEGGTGRLAGSLSATCLRVHAGGAHGVLDGAQPGGAAPQNGVRPLVERGGASEGMNDRLG